MIRTVKRSAVVPAAQAVTPSPLAISPPPGDQPAGVRGSGGRPGREIGPMRDS